MNEVQTERFWASVDKNGPIMAGMDSRCWIWTRSFNKGRYGRFSMNHAWFLAHRLSYELITKTALGKQQLDHRCRNTTCVNPSHLRPATDQQQKQNRQGANRNSLSGLRGVQKNHDRWAARVTHNRKSLYLGTFDTPEEAAEVARLKRNELFTHNEADR